MRLSPAQTAHLDVQGYVWLIQAYTQQATSLLPEAISQPDGPAARQLQVRPLKQYCAAVVWRRLLSLAPSATQVGVFARLVCTAG